VSYFRLPQIEKVEGEDYCSTPFIGNRFCSRSVGYVARELP